MTFSTPTTSTTTTTTMTSSEPPSFVTQSVVTTETSLVHASVVTSCTTFWEYYHTTITATRGQTIAFSTPSPSTPPTSIPTTKIFPTYAPTITTIITETQFAIYLQSPSATTVYSTWTLPLTSAYAPQITTTNPPGQLVYVVDPAPTGWPSWSPGAKAGLIIGVVFAALLLLLLLWCICKRMQNNEWIAHDWRWARNVEGGPAPGANVVPTVAVSGPLDRSFATPYGYGPGYGYGGGYGHGQQQGHPGWGWMRGGGGEEGVWSRTMVRVKGWFRKKDNVVAVMEEEMRSEEVVKQPGGQDKPETLRSIKTKAFYRLSRKDKRAALFDSEVV